MDVLKTQSIFVFTAERDTNCDGPMYRSDRTQPLNLDLLIGTRV